jgi:hypothetical protein
LCGVLYEKKHDYFSGNFGGKLTEGKQKDTRYFGEKRVFLGL